MTPAEIEAILTTAFSQCDLEGHPLTPRQQQIILASAGSQLMAAFNRAIAPQAQTNPLDDLSPDQRRALLTYIQTHGGDGSSWKVQLLNDWLAGRDSGQVQFIRDELGLPWLDRIQPSHIYQYLEQWDADSLTLSVGDRIEVSNALWEWVQNGTQEWLPCLVIQVNDATADRGKSACIVRFENGMEVEIQGIYDWNRYNWRFAQS